MPGINKQIIQTGGGGSGTPGGSDTQVQFNDGGAFGGDARFYFDKSTGGATGGDFEVEAGASIDGGGAGLFVEGGKVGRGGSVQAFAGNAITTDSDGGQLYFGSGSGNGTGAGGKVRFQAGSSPGGQAGDVQFEIGEGLINGRYLFKTSNNLYAGELDFESLTADRKITFQDAAGTVAYLSDIGGGTVTEVEIDFGSGVPVSSKKFTITDAGVSGTSKILVYPSGNVATGRVGDDWEWDSIAFAAKAGTGNFTLTAKASGRIRGKRKIFYSFS